MKNFTTYTMLIFVILSLATAACAQRVATTVELQKIDVALVPEKHLLTGESSITFTAVGKRAEFTLSPAAVIERIVVAGKPSSSFIFKDGRLVVDLSDTRKTASVTVAIFYHAEFNDPSPMHPVGSEDPTYGVNGTITRQGVFLGSGAGWYPAPVVTPTRRIIGISAPAGIEAVTAGKRVARTTTGGVSRSGWEERRPVGELSISAGPYRIDERNVDGVDIQAYFYPDNAALAPRYLDAAVKYIHMYKELFGPYPFEKFAVVENFLPTGYAFPSYTLLGSQVIRLPFIINTSSPHEIAHNWWGNGVLVDYSRGNWSEGLATYLADYLMKEKSSETEARDYRFKLVSDYAALVSPERAFALQDFSGRIDPASRAIGYGKSAMLFHMVRTMIGDKAFFGALQEICRERLYRTASWSDFTRAFSKSSGRDLAPFMEQLLSRPGGPRLALPDVTRRRTGEGWSVSGQIVQIPPFYQLSVPLRLETAAGSEHRTVEIDREKTNFTITVPAAPQLLSLDPDMELFRLLSPAELPPTVSRIKGSDKLLVVITKDCKASKNSVQMLLESLRQSDATVVDEEKLSEDLLRRHDLLFCGVPGDNVLPVPPVGIDFTGKGFSIEGERFNNQDDLLFLVQVHPLNNQRIAALFLPLSEGAAKRHVSRITHYGTYGYLAFAGVNNLRKGTLPAAETGAIAFRDEVIK